MHRSGPLPPPLAHVASPSPAKIKSKLANSEKPRLAASESAPVKLPAELFALATSRKSMEDPALSRALENIQAAVSNPQMQLRDPIMWVGCVVLWPAWMQESTLRQQGGRRWTNHLRRPQKTCHSLHRAVGYQGLIMVHVVDTRIPHVSVSYNLCLHEWPPTLCSVRPCSSQHPTFLWLQQASRLESERTKLVIQSQELQIWDMAREEELVLLRVRAYAFQRRAGWCGSHALAQTSGRFSGCGTWGCGMPALHNRPLSTILRATAPAPALHHYAYPPG